MFELIVDILGFSAVLFGIIALVYIASIVIVSPKARGRMVILLPCGDSNDCVRMLYSAQLRLTLFAGCCKGEVIAVDMGMTDEQRKACEDICREYHNTHIITPQEITTYLSKDEV